MHPCERVRTVCSRGPPPALLPSRLAVEKAMKMSPDPSKARPPVRPRPSPARRASRLHWSGVSGASVATTMMIEPSSLGVGWSACSLPGMREVGICLPTGTPLMSRSSRLP